MRAVILSLVVFAVGCGGRESVTRKYTQEWPAGTVDALSVRTVDGRITIKPSADDKVRLSAETRLRGPNVRRRSGQLVATPRLEGSTVVLRETNPRKIRTPWQWVWRDRRNSRFDFEVPENVRVNLTTVNGSIDVQGVEAGNELRTVNGRINVSTRSSPVSARTVNGRIEVEFLESFPGARIRTVNGRVTVRVPPTASLIGRISQVNGSFESNIPIELRRRSDVERDGESLLDVTTVNGDISVRRSGEPRMEPEALEPVESPEAAEPL
jgi:hypothetical protein